MKKQLLIFLTLLSSCVLTAAKIDTLKTYSNVMNKEIPAVVVTPDSYSELKALPVVYLLHGYSDSALNGWINKGKDIDKYADLYDVILVMPDGGFSSWYFDSPIDPEIQYESYIIEELIPLIDEKYATIASRTGRAITGLSMGGHGALYLSFRHQNVFAAAGSTSGGVDIRPFPNNWSLIKCLGTYVDYPENWEKNTIVNMTHLLTPNSLSLIIDCGREDFFYDVNCKLHEKLLYYNIPHEFTTRPGKHDWNYWSNSIQYQLLFFHNYFVKNAGE